MTNDDWMANLRFTEEGSEVYLAQEAPPTQAQVAIMWQMKQAGFNGRTVRAEREATRRVTDA
jgi:hypothetical protein